MIMPGAVESASRRLCSVLAFVLAVSSGAAHAAFTTPVPVSAAQSSFHNESDVAVRPDGSAVFIWRQNIGLRDRAQMRVRSAAGVLGPVATLSNTTGNAIANFIVVVDNEGDALFVWLLSVNFSTDIRVQTRALSAAGVLGPIQTVSTANKVARDVTVDVDADGDALFVWHDRTGASLVARLRGKTGTLGAIETVSTLAYQFSAPAVGLSDSGDALIAFALFDSATNRTRLQARPRSAAGVYGPAIAISAASLSAEPARLGIDAAGNALIAWGATFADNSKRVQARSRAASGTLGAILTLSPVYSSSGSLAPEVAVNANGAGVVAWLSSCDTKDFLIRRSSTATTGGAFSPARRLPVSGECIVFPFGLAIDGAGNALGAWRPLGDTEPLQHIRARQLSAANATGAITTFSPLQSDHPVAAMNDTGKAAIVWRQGPVGGSRFMATVGP
jgi:hypothetical protein